MRRATWQIGLWVGNQRLRKGLLEAPSSHAAAPSRTARNAYGVYGLPRIPKSSGRFGLGSGKMSGGGDCRYIETILDLFCGRQAVASVF